MPSTYGDRLQQALTHAGKTAADLAPHLVSPDGTRGISKSAVHQVLRGETKAHTAENCVRAARFLKVDPFWLATGQGAMVEHETPRVVAREPEAPYGVSDADALAQLRQLLQRLPPDLRSTAADILSGWARTGGEDDRAAVLIGLSAIQVKRQA